MAYITKEELVSKLREQLAAEGLELSFDKVKAIVNGYHEVTDAELRRGNSISVGAVGKIEVKMHKPRTVRNIKTGQLMNVPAKLTPKLVVSKKFKGEINEGI